MRAHRPGRGADAAEERRHLARLARAHPLVAWDSVLFSARESVYKAWFPLTGRWLGFLDRAVLPDRAAAPDPTRGTFTAVLRVPGPELAGGPPGAVHRPLAGP
ncbi:4'-phosphopantetheinyl transferase superfamily protein [Streptomyces sp. SAS_281]|uniref:4'-phosphopantetheinyl transferase superfamily protein n=1 Tax=Streptomyces sp. SAS_281 TaxID=3412744 RepID=UPI00403C2380